MSGWQDAPVVSAAPAWASAPIVQAAVPSPAPPSNPAAGSATLQVGPWNTHIPIPSAVNEPLEGIGKTLTDLRLGAEQLGAKGLAAISSRYRNLPAQLAKQAAVKRATDAPLMKTWGGWLGAQAPAAGAMLIPGLQGLGGMTALGAGIGALTPTAPGESRLLNTGVGGALGAVGKLGGDALGGWLSRRVGTAVAPALTDAQKAALNQGASLGMRVTPGQRAASKPLQQIETWAQSHPWTSGPFARYSGGNQAALDRVAAQSIGEDAPNVDATVLGRANDRLGSVFENVRSPERPVLVDPDATQAFLDQLDSDNEGVLPNDMSIRDNKLVGQLDSLMHRANEGAEEPATVTAKQLGQLSSKLGKAAFKQMTGPAGDRDLGKALYAVKEHVDDLLESGLSPEERAEYAAARQQYRNLMLLTSRGSIVNPSTGHVNGAALASKLQQADRRGFTFGKNQSDLYKGARFAQAFKPIVGDSGTATRTGGHTGLWSGALLADALARGAPLEHAIAEAAIPTALRLGSNLGARAYLNPLGQRAIRGALRSAGAASRGAAVMSRLTSPFVRYGLRAGGLNAVPLWRNSP